ncbi:LysM peptidoglycan-binding domain-containing protein [Tumebacillus sp. ITR2]|uniref:LysM peptidoglycan-binding domain-containing protein n=1 Tax=Tumebacillus amylolyticus TaxID=2801339 RepID=A0ABS1J9Y2_9BACL|nr:LysM peptidoglycan-binding domain-containing protein [Tumebacillus amylolyticus]MBL0386443.1 LysM peptidoglycan-binding domain-containing protein [Tumebacillus amylolyticus]
MMNMKKNWKHLLVGTLMMAGALTLINTKAEAAAITVQPGQTLSELAKVNGTTVAAVKFTNNLKSDVVLAGQTLNMPFPYKVGNGDYMSYLAKRYNTTIADIKRVNHLDRENLFIGEVITIPVGKNTNITPVVKAIETSPAPAKGAEHAATPAPARAEAKAPTPVRTTPVLAPVKQPAAPTVAGKEYSKTVDVAATAYGPGNIMWQWGGKTKMGTQVREGVISVDPNVIPLGSKVWVTGYNSPLLPAGGFFATAEDTGGAIKGNRIDIYIDANHTQLIQFGKQNIQLYILK